MQNSSLSVSHKNIEHDHTNSLSGWCSAYLALVVKGSSPATYEAKKRDLHLFLRFSEKIGVGDRVQLWVPTLSKSFKDRETTGFTSATIKAWPSD